MNVLGEEMRDANQQGTASAPSKGSGSSSKAVEARRERTASAPAERRGTTWVSSASSSRAVASELASSARERVRAASSAGLGHAIKWMARASCLGDSIRDSIRDRGTTRVNEPARETVLHEGETDHAVANRIVLFAGEALDLTRTGTILEASLHRAPCNEIGTTMLAELERVAEYVTGGAAGARALVFTSEMEKGFSAGADLRELHAGIRERRGAGSSRLGTAIEARKFIDRIHAVYDAFDCAPFTTVAAVHGFCFGGGFELALTADVIVADKSARFSFPELRLGLVPGFGGIPRLRRDVGNAVIRDLLFTGRSVNAQRGHELGLVSQVVARGQAPNVARMVAAQASKFDQDTLEAAKRFVKPIPRAELDREKDLFMKMLASPAVERALTRFTERTDAMPYLP